jgi:hypothetical protein
MKARREQVDEKLIVIKLFALNYARDLIKEFDDIYDKKIIKRYDKHDT